MRRKSFILFLVLVLTMASSVVFAERDLAVRIDSTNIKFDQEFGVPFVDENNHILVPFRIALEAFGADVDWDEATSTAKATKEDVTIEVPIGEEYIVKNDERIDNDSIAILKDGRTYLSIKNVMEAFGAEVQWDEKVSTLVITSEPFDAKARILEAYEKQYAWENYDMYMLMNMSMAMPDEVGNVQEIDMQMDMSATAFMNPMKLKADANMIMDLEGFEFTQPFMEMYMVAEGNKFITYTGMTDPTSGELTWIKQEVEDDSLGELIDPNNEQVQELNEQSIKDVKYLGSYTEEGRKFDKYEITITFEGFDEIMKQSMAMVSNTLGDQDLQMSLDLISNLDDMVYILYLDEAGEFTKMEMDLSSMMNSMFAQMTDVAAVDPELLEELSEEELEEFNNMFSEIMGSLNIKLDMVAEYLNINEAEDFEIPEEALNAITMEEYLEELEEMLEELEQLEEAGELEEPQQSEEA